MHDYHAMKALIERLLETPMQDVAEVRVRAGPGFSPEALALAYEMLTPDTPLEGSRLVVEPVVEATTCPSCGRSWLVTEEEVAGVFGVCPSCGTASPIHGLTGLEVVAVS